MLKKILLTLFLVISFLAPVQVKAATAPPECSSLGINLDFPTEALNNDDIIVKGTFSAGSFDPNISYSVLITNADASNQVALSTIVKDLDFIPGPIKLLIGAIPISLPVGSNSSESQAEKVQDGIADFIVPVLTQTGTHYVKLKQSGQTDPICLVTSPTINIKDSNDLSSYICIPGSKNPSDPNRICEIGAGKSCSASGYNGIETAIGCIPTDPKNLVEQLLKFVMGVSGGIALLLMSIASFQMVTSQGNAENLKNAHARFIDAIVGLLFIIFATLILQIIGFTILNIPGFHP